MTDQQGDVFAFIEARGACGAVYGTTARVYDRAQTLLRGQNGLNFYRRGVEPLPYPLLHCCRQFP